MIPQFWTLLCVLVTLTSSSIVKTPSDGDNFELLILHNNDMHARFEQTSQLSGACTVADRDAGKCYGGFPRVAHVVKEARKAAASGEGPPVLYLNAGDTYTGTAWFTIYKWKIAAEFLNALQPDAVSLGNHEFDNGISGLAPFIQNLTCPVLAANLILKKVLELEREPKLRKSYIFNVSGRRIGVVGYLTPATKVLTTPNDVEYIDEKVALKSEVSKLKSKGVDIIIALGHSGYAKDLEIAREVKGLSLVIGGHSNTFLWNGTVPDVEKAIGPYPTYVTQSSGVQVPVVQAYAYTKYLGQLYMVFNSKGRLVTANGKPILLDKTIPQDTEVLKIIEHYQEEVLNVTKEVIGTTETVLDGLSCQEKECNLGNLITDAMVYYYAKKYNGDYLTDAPISILQGGGIRASITHTQMPSVVTKGDLITVMPFGGSLVLVTMKGGVLFEVLEHSVANSNNIDLPGEFLQVSGLKVTYDLTRNIGSRVIKAEAKCWKCSNPEYKLVKVNEDYNVLMPDFIQQGGDGFNMLINQTYRILEYNELTCSIEFIKDHSPINITVEGRLTIFKERYSANTSNNVTIYLILLISQIVLLLLFIN